MRPTFAEINLTHLNYNFLNIRKKVKNSKVMAVVKANAYGHGLLHCVKSLSSLGTASPEYYGVALLEEGIEIRKSKITPKPILTFSPFMKSELDSYLKFNIYPTFCDEFQLADILNYRGNKKLGIHINIDTGMGRLGIHYSDAVKMVRKISKNMSVKIEGIYTHFATSDEKNKSYALLQLKRFREIIKTLSEERIETGLIHAANSGAILDLPDANFDMVRPGISLYGYYPSESTTESIKLRPVMSIISEISTIRHINKGESVSYGRKFIAKKPTVAATIPIGYADGFYRGLTNKANAIIRGKRFQQIGRVTMDRILFDVTGSNARPGDKVILMGKYKTLRIDAWDWANIFGSIPYEITCNISSRVPRIYVN